MTEANSDAQNTSEMRHIKIKSIDGNTYEVSVPKDVRYISKL